MSSRLTMLLHGSLEDVDYLLDTFEMSEQELRAAMQRLLREIQQQNSRLDKLEKK